MTQSKQLEIFSDARLEQIMSTLGDIRISVDEIRERIAGVTKEHYTVEEVARATGRDPYTVRRWIRDEKLKAIRIDGSGPRGRLLVPRAELKRLIGDGKAAQMSAFASS